MCVWVGVGVCVCVCPVSAGSRAKPFSNASAILGLYFASFESYLTGQLDDPSLPDALPPLLAGTQLCVCVCVCVCACVRARVCVCVCTCTCVRLHVHGDMVLAALCVYLNLHILCARLPVRGGVHAG